MEEHGNTKGILTIYMETTEIQMVRAQTSENMGCDLRRCNFSTIFSLFS